ncbi:tyrosine-protein phosphatase non-receptor type substrate 1-like [Crotalus tigris]|uniref:tyrosine-protein phosphatase non-receptor type substrate 1-like n=1 Tax=Crotalus tigris TaxID=88082 RepID=UPI00192F8BED|nr:tyrosine-protein phosphatase non-receptor type substrate 1-like [Crotalus tigris]
MAALRSFKRIPGPLQLLLLLFLPQDLVKPFELVLRGPTGRITAGSPAPFQCIANYFSTKEMKVAWIKDGKEIQAAQESNCPFEVKGESFCYAKSSLTIPLGQGDVRSQLTCQIQQNSLEVPFQRTLSLGEVLRVPPKVRLETSPPSPVQLNAPVMVTCLAESFYPDDAKVELFPKDAPSRKGTVAPRISNPDGTFSLKTYLEMVATEDRNSSMFLCKVQHNSQPLVNESTILSIITPLESSEKQQSITVLCISWFLSKVAFFLFVSCFFVIKMSRCKKPRPRSRTFPET